MDSSPRILRFDFLSLTSTVLLLVASLFYLSLFLKQLGVIGLLQMFRVVDQTLFDAGDFLFLLLLPAVTLSLTLVATVRQKSGRLRFILLGAILALYLTASIAGYSIIDWFYESHHLSLYGE